MVLVFLLRRVSKEAAFGLSPRCEMTRESNKIRHSSVEATHLTIHTYTHTHIPGHTFTWAAYQDTGYGYR